MCVVVVVVVVVVVGWCVCRRAVFCAECVSVCVFVFHDAAKTTLLDGAFYCVNLVWYNIYSIVYRATQCGIRRSVFFLKKPSQPICLYM